ncbi:hypothetical protein pEaSNUABM11_00138 [Erwinia phage pEa_SNUABM_11]|nr:hypothetical protein pEaSNUABM11_00138 [Erwinia phage pEa_SNUABM_11]
MQINRRLAKNKDIVYEITDGEDVVFHGVVDAQTRVMHVVVPGPVTRPIERVMEKLIAKAKHRDGIAKDYKVRAHCEFVEKDGETLIMSVAETA